MTKPVTILYIDNSFTFGGAIISLRTTIRALDKKRFRPVLVTAQSSAYLAGQFPEIQWTSLAMKLPWVHDHYYKKISGSRLVQNHGVLKKLIGRVRSVFWFFRFTLPEAFALYRIGKKQGAGLVHLNNALGGQLPGVIAAKLLGVPCVAHLRDYETPCRSARLTAARIDHHIAISGSIKNNLLSLGVAGEKISIVHDSVELNDFSEKTKDRSIAGDLVAGRSGVLIGWFGRIIEWKGLAEFVLGINALRKNFDDFTAVVAGDSSDFEDTYYRMVRDLVRGLELDDRIVFAGYRQDVIAVMQQMDIVVHSSITPEPFGMVVIEAMACAKPVVASAAGGGPLEIVDHGRTGYLVNVKDPAEISGALLALAKDKELRKQLGSAGRKRVETLFASDVHVKAIEKIYERFLGERRDNA